MKHINITNWQGNITDWTKFNYIYGGLDDELADRVNLRIPGTNLRNYFRKSNNIVNLSDVIFTYESAQTFFIRVWKSPYSTLLGYKQGNWSTTAYNTFKFTLTEAITIRIQWGYDSLGFAIKDMDLPAGTYYFGCNYSNISNTVTFSNNGIYKTLPTTYEPYGSMVMVENVDSNLQPLDPPKITVFNQVDLGTLAWAYTAIGEPSYFNAHLPNVVNSIDVSCPLYKSAWVFSTNTEDKVICTVQNEVRIRDNALQGSVIDLNAKLKGVIMLYEPASSSANTLSMSSPMQLGKTNVEEDIEYLEDTKFNEEILSEEE